MNSISGHTHYRRTIASDRALRLLGPAALPATDQLYRILTSASSAEPKKRAANALANICPETQPTLPVLLYALTNSNADTRLCAVRAINRLSAEMRDRSTNRLTAIPALITSLADTNTEIIGWSIDTLVSLRLPPKQFLPILTNLLSHPNARINERASAEITRITWRAPKPDAEKH